jgi:hypothetical protein
MSIKKAIAILALFAGAALPAPAYVEAIIPLNQVITESTVIVEGKVESHDAQKKIAAIKVGKTIKGKSNFEMIRLTYAGGQFWHPEGIPKHLVPGAPVLIFYNDALQSQVYLTGSSLALRRRRGAARQGVVVRWPHTRSDEPDVQRHVPQLTETVKKVRPARSEVADGSAHVRGALPPGETQDDQAAPAVPQKYDPTRQGPDAAGRGGQRGFISGGLLKRCPWARSPPTTTPP